MRQAKQKLSIAFSFFLLLMSLCSCSTYKSGFSCRDARGLPCTSMEEIDRLISSGEIEEYTASKRERQKEDSLRGYSRSTSKQKKQEQCVGSYCLQGI